MSQQTSQASSPSPDEATQPSRKRLRSQSMQSDASSSSLKRTVTDANLHDGTVRSPRTDQMSTLSIADPNQDIDSYMAEQGEDDVAPLDTSGPPQSQNSAPALPKTAPSEEKLAFVEKSKNRAMKVGEVWYLVARDWWKRWRKAMTGEIDKEGSVDEQNLGPIDNTRLLDSYGNLQLSMIEGVDVEFVPEDVWRCFLHWYGEAIHPLPRRTIQRGTSKQTSLELRPPLLKVFQLVDSNTSISSSPKNLIISAGETITTLRQQLAASLLSDVHKQAPYRTWKIEPVDQTWNSIDLPRSELANRQGKVLEDSERTLEEEGVQSGDCFVVEFNPGPIVETQQHVQPPPSTGSGLPTPLFNSKDGFFDRMSKSTTASASTSVTRADNFYDSMSSSWKTSGQKERALEPGTLGLGNMGNTCFMNSALQCLAHSKELTDYFLTGLYEEELNPDNPLGMHGAIAEAFGALLQRIWASAGTSTSYSPREFKTQLQRFAPQFSGYQQHDSQELVAFLLDGLHEDLNRVLKKPYVEKPDWEGGGDIELVKLAKESWEGYMKRNDSVIVDLFQGQYKSTLICPECQKVSITFDPFMYLTLPLPVHKKWRHDIFYIPWDLQQPHVKIPVEINRDASFKDLRALLGRWMNTNPDNLLTLEIFNHRFYKNLDDSLSCGDMADSDLIVCFELPCHAQQSRAYKRQPDDPFIVPVYLCDLNAPARLTYLTNRTPFLFGYPMVVAITREQATNVDAIYDAVLMQLQRWTTNARDLFQWEQTSSNSEMEEVPIQYDNFQPADSLTEIKENGEVITMQETDPQIVDQKDSTVSETSAADNAAENVVSRVGTKKDVFNLRLQANHKDYGTQITNPHRLEPWERRIEEAATQPGLLRDGDALYCEFDENVKAYYFGDERSRWEHALWEKWQDFHHPEYLESKKATSEKRNKGISLQDCLDEFTKEEKLGEDDLWYCPRCKEHRQATKKFDIWKMPDVLVVHLKRFSNSRTLRDKIDAFVDFPVEGLDLSDMVGQRAVAKRLSEQGVTNLEQYKMDDLDEPLVYDLFGVDEHMGGLGGGHYRAYALNHFNGKWYHFDDSYVTPARASDAVNANAYLLFYRRRSAKPLGGKTHHKVEEARSRPRTRLDDNITIDAQLPTPPNESSGYVAGLPLPAPQPLPSNSWSLRSHQSNAGSYATSPSPEALPTFEESQIEEVLDDKLDPLQRFDFPDPSGRTSPTPSNEAVLNTDSDELEWEGARSRQMESEESTDGQSGMGSPDPSGKASPTPSNEAAVNVDSDEPDWEGVRVIEAKSGDSTDERIHMGSPSSASSISDIGVRVIGDSGDSTDEQIGAGSPSASSTSDVGLQ